MQLRLNETDVSNFSSSSASGTRAGYQKDGTSVSSNNTILLSSLGSPHTTLSWPGKIIIPPFSVATEAVRRNANVDDALLNNTRIRSEILEKLADYMYSYTPPTSHQIGEVEEALVNKHPCLTEPRSHNGWIGWMYSLKYKMGNYWSKLGKLGFPEVTCNSLENKHPVNREPFKKCKETTERRSGVSPTLSWRRQ